MSSDDVTWEREEHTEAKHNLLRAFFNKWVSIHSEFFRQRPDGVVRIYDGFAGPGVYSGGEPGSPVILLRALCENPRLVREWATVDYEFRFVELDRRRAARLQDELEQVEVEMRQAGKCSDRVSWSARHGRYEEHPPQHAPGRRSALFLFLDPFGYSHSPMTLTRDLVRQPKADTLIFVPLSFVHRFASREGQDAALDRFFGSDEWRDIPDGPGRPRQLLELFRKQLRTGGLRYTLPFQLKPPDGRNEYWIVGASDHEMGFESIKEGFWNVDPVNGQGFAATGTTGQDSLFEQGAAGPNTAPLLAELRDKFAQRWFSVEEAISVTADSRFLKSHLKNATLRPAERNGTLEVDRPPGARQFKEGRGIRMRFK